MTFFSKANYKFLPIPEDQRIVTTSFLDACAEVIPFFDVLGPTAFSPVKSDINGNITKLRKKYDTNSEKFVTIQDFVESEIEEGTTKDKNSATDALLWLKRALEFIRVFLEQVLTGEQDLTKCSKVAYESTLKKYHGWIVQSIFSIAMKAVPYRKDFIAKLANEETEEKVIEDMTEHLDLLGQTIDVINELYRRSEQDKQEKV